MVEEDRDIEDLLHRSQCYEMVIYEEMYQDPSRVSTETLTRIANLMEVSDEFDPVPRYRKIGLPLDQAIRNFDDVVSALGPEGAKRFVDPYV
tara:strand:+ start:2533 stop:2808 length:276 start_codon:yes stop_codon:yes gene_type:complete